jgi:hypothetical protein
MATGPLEGADAAIKVGDAATARLLLERADPADPRTLEALAQACYLELDYLRAIEAWESAYPLYRTTGDPADALRVARALAGVYSTRTTSAGPRSSPPRGPARRPGRVRAGRRRGTGRASSRRSRRS